MPVVGGLDEPPLSSVLVTPTSFSGVSVTLSVLLSLFGLGSVTPGGGATVAVLSSVPVSVESMVRVSWKPVLAPLASVPVVKWTVLVMAS